MVDSIRPRFPLGRIVSTRGALEVLCKAGQSPAEFLNRHAAADWGDICTEDWKLNDEAIVIGERLLSAYTTKAHDRIWIITEAARNSTCILRPSEY